MEEVCGEGGMGMSKREMREKRGEEKEKSRRERTKVDGREEWRERGSKGWKLGWKK